MIESEGEIKERVLWGGFILAFGRKKQAHLAEGKERIPEGIRS